MVKDLEALTKFRSFEALEEPEKARYVKYLDEDMIPFLSDVRHHYEKQAQNYQGIIEERSKLELKFKQNPMVYSMLLNFHFNVYKKSVLDDFVIRFYLTYTKYESCWKLLSIYENFRLMSGLYKETLKSHRTDLELQPLVVKFDELHALNKKIWSDDLHKLHCHTQELQKAYSTNLKKHQAVQINHIKEKPMFNKFKNYGKLVKLQIKSRI